jgi:two-component system chemotaxis sensor kinase CheA
MLKWLKNYVTLPPEITPFERTYLERINKIALYFFLGHLPVFVLVAAIAGTGPMRAAILTSLVLVGPVVAYVTLKNPRHMSVASGFTAMCLGGLLVHFGRGSMQIEMHFYFFVLIALLAVFANPIAVITAAVTVAVHHLLMFLFLPSSVFNYDASLWAVAVHALFVVLESIATCFVARSFFDNVIGLERIVANRTRELDGRNRAMELVLDNVDQGFLTVSLDGKVDPERSAVADSWLGPHIDGAPIWTVLTRLDAGVGRWLEVSWSTLSDDILPGDMAIDQLPRRMTRDQQSWSLQYKPIVNDAGAISKILLVITDITGELGRERAEVAQRDFQSVMSHITKDRAGFMEFFQESQALVETIELGTLDLVAAKRAVHTLKGNCAVFGMSYLVSICHETEKAMQDQRAMPTAADRRRISEEFQSMAGKLSDILATSGSSLIEIDEREIDTLVAAMRGSATLEQVGERLRAWKLEPTERRLQRVATQIRATAARLGMSPVDIVMEPNDLRLAPAPLREFWGAFTHAVRNALDHGIESPSERQASGKPLAGRIRLATKKVGDDLVLEFSDDGRGIDWDAVRKRAQAAEIPHASREDLIAALFHDGLSTSAEVTETSGRGIGMGALRAACAKTGGRAEVSSVPGRGTALQFLWPWHLLTAPADTQQHRRAG